MQANEILRSIESSGGALWVTGESLGYRIPESESSLVDQIRTCKWELLELLAQRPVVPAGVRLVSWSPKDAPVRLSECETVTDTEKFIRSTLRQLEAQLSGKDSLAGAWGLSGLLTRLEACGCRVALEDRRKALQ
jgi:hypothetical protein